MKRLLPMLAVVLLSACGGGGNSASVLPSTQPTAATTAVQINLGDDPADRLLAANLTVNSVSLMTAAGGSVTVMSTPRPMEVMRLMGTVAPLAIANVPQGTYTGASMTFGSATVMHMDPATGQVTQRQVTGPMTGSVTFPTPMVVGTAPMVVNLDIDMTMSIAIDGAGNVTMTPFMTARTNPMTPGGADPENGGLRGMTGVVGGTGVAQGTFSLSMMQGLTTIPMGTGAGTQYMGMTGMGMMQNGFMVTVDATMQPDGSWSASNVQWRMAGGGAMANGVVLTLTGSPVSQVVLAMHDGIGGGMTAGNLAGTTTANITDATTFSIDTTNVDLAGLPFTPAFSRASLTRGQRIEALSTSQMTSGGGMGGMMGGGTLTATSIRLAEQGLRGTVSSYSQSGSAATFVLTLPADSAFAKLTGSTSFVVYQRAATQVRGATPTNGSRVQVRGLLFNDAGTFRFVASRIVQ